MNAEVESPYTMISDSALEPYRLVKLKSGDVTRVQYNTVGNDEFLGITTGRAEAAARHITVRDRYHPGMFKVTAAEAFAVGASLYAAADGKVQDTVSGVPLGKAMQAAAGNDSIVTMQLYVDGTVNGALLVNVANADAGVPLVIMQVFDGSALEVHIFDAAVPRKLRIIDAWVLITAAGGAGTTLTLDDGTDAITDAIDIYNTGGVGDKDIVRAGEIDDAKSDLAAGDTLDITLSNTTTAPEGIVYILAVPIA